MSRYKELLQRIDDLEAIVLAHRNCHGTTAERRIVDGLSERLKHLECSEHEWLFTGVHNSSPIGFYFECNECGKKVIRFERSLTGTMRPQLEVLGYLKPIKKIKKAKEKI